MLFSLYPSLLATMYVYIGSLESFTTTYEFMIRDFYASFRSHIRILIYIHFYLLFVRTALPSFYNASKYIVYTLIVYIYFTHSTASNLHVYTKTHTRARAQHTNTLPKEQEAHTRAHSIIINTFSITNLCVFLIR